MKQNNIPLCYAYKILNTDKKGFIEALNDFDAYHQLSNEFNVKQNEVLISVYSTWDEFQSEIGNVNEN